MAMQDTAQLGAAIREARKRLKVTKKDLATTSGTGLRFVIDLERGKPTCQIGKVLKVLQTLGLHVELSGSGATAQEGGAS